MGSPDLAQVTDQLETIIRERLREQRRASAAKRDAFDTAQAARIAEAEQQADAFERMVRPHLRNASRHGYEQWLRGYLLAGGEVTHFYDYPMNRQSGAWYMATEAFRLLPLYGANSVRIIVPVGVPTPAGELGHSNLFIMDGYRVVGDFVPMFSDIDL